VICSIDSVIHMLLRSCDKSDCQGSPYTNTNTNTSTRTTITIIAV